MDAGIFAFGLRGGNDMVQGFDKPRIIILAHDPHALRQVVGTDKGRIDAVDAQDFFEVFHRSRRLDLDHQDVFLVALLHVLSRRIDFFIAGMLTQQRNTPVAHRIILGVFHQRLRLFDRVAIRQ